MSKRRVTKNTINPIQADTSFNRSNWVSPGGPIELTKLKTLAASVLSKQKLDLLAVRQYLLRNATSDR